MSKNEKKQKVSTKVIVTRWLCGILAGLMVVGGAIYTIQFLISMFAA
jgi:hypothetical protein